MVHQIGQGKLGEACRECNAGASPPPSAKWYEPEVSAIVVDSIVQEPVWQELLSALPRFLVPPNRPCVDDDPSLGRDVIAVELVSWIVSRGISSGTGGCNRMASFRAACGLLILPRCSSRTPCGPATCLTSSCTLAISLGFLIR